MGQSTCCPRIHSDISSLTSSLLPHHAYDSIVGISIGCILGMVPLLFVDTFKKVWKMMHRGAEIILRVCLCLVLTRLSKIRRSRECFSTSLTVMAKVRASQPRCTRTAAGTVVAHLFLLLLYTKAISLKRISPRLCRMSTLSLPMWVVAAYASNKFLPPVYLPREAALLFDLSLSLTGCR